MRYVLKFEYQNKIMSNLPRKKICKIKKFKKGHISIPRTKGFDVAF